MSIFDSLFKLKTVDINTEKIKLLMEVTHNKLAVSEVERIYHFMDSKIMKAMPRNVQIIEAMQLLNKAKGDWLTRDEKESFVAGVWMFDTLDTTNPKNQTYINAEQLKYVKQAVLGDQFKAARTGEYYENLKEYMYKY